MLKFLSAVFLLTVSGLNPALVQADTTLKCEVRSVHDGDSMRVKCPGERQTLRVRMNQIDAPELDQAFGKQARDQLRTLCPVGARSEEHTSELQSREKLVCRLLLEKK